jgi:sterol desaturase/sphingolipid hydroxylase (fatty acid hydroxylase superfamily)
VLGLDRGHFSSLAAVIRTLQYLYGRSCDKKLDGPHSMTTNFFNMLLLIALTFVPLERLLARRPQPIFRRGWLNDLICWLINGYVVAFCLGILFVGVTMSASWLMPISVREVVANQPYWVQIAEIVILADTGVYFAHRMFHAVPWLWRFHAIHHSSEELDWLSAARVHPLDQFVTRGCSLLPVFALGFSEIAIGAYVLLYVWQVFFIHSNLRINLGPLRWLLASPEFHHWHHSNDREARDSNFAAQLPLLDFLFGTLYMPRGRAPSSFGLDQPIPGSYPAQLLYPFQSAPKERPLNTELNSAR